MSGIEKIMKKGIENKLFPFFWQHGENHEVLEKYMDKIYESGIYGVCIEARPHPKFIEEQWWSDLDCIIAKAKEKNMEMWILDDSHFPTGYANGRIKSDYPQYLKKYLGCRRYDVHGPLNGARIDLKMLKGRPWEKLDTEKEIFGVYIAERALKEWDDDYGIKPETLVDITNQIDKATRLLTLDVSSGAYSIFVVYTTMEEGEAGTKDYLNPLVKEATEVLLREVYEPHFEHYSQEFGTTIKGFFSDEPRFGNIKGTDGFIGRVDMVLPWSENLINELQFDSKYLPLLWYTAENKESEIRYKYMDTITKLYNQNFTKVLSDWCEAHEIIYIGHTIEDNGAHARLGYGTGHYFRGQQDMHMAGIDVIGGQVVPGMNYQHDAFNTGGSNGEFYHYALAKLGTSAAHLDPKKMGRTMCEAYGAYGWNEGLKMMKWITDHLLVRGVNYIVPHAFDPKEFPDFDCPPHFYAHGHNPQFRYMKVLNEYINRISNMFSDGIQPSKVGVFYPAETEWMGEYMPIEKPAKALTRNQITFDIVTTDYLKSSTIGNGKYIINKIEFEVFVVPYGKCITDELLYILNKMLLAGVKVVFINEYPQVVIPTQTNLGDDYLEKFNFVKENAVVTTLSNLGTELNQYKDILLNTECPDLVVGKYELEDKMVYMFFNEAVDKAVDVVVEFKEAGNVYLYDSFADEVYLGKENGNKGHTLNLAPYESIIVIISKEEIETSTDKRITFKDLENSNKFTRTILEDNRWNVTFGDSFAYPNCDVVVPTNNIGLINTLSDWENVTGTVRFTTAIEIDIKKANKIILDLGNVFEIAEVFVNGKSAGQKIAKPYVFDISKHVLEGENTLSIEVTNTLGTKIRDVISHYLMIEPFGIEGQVAMYIEKER